MRRAHQFLALVTGCGFLYITIKSLRWWFRLHHPWYDYLWGSALGFAAIGLGVLPRSPIRRLPERGFLILLTVIFAASRLWWVALVPTKPVSDFAMYQAWAEMFSQGRPLDAVLGQSKVFLVHAWGYPLALGGLYAIVGSSVLAAKLLNVVAGALSLLLLYRLGKAVSGEDAGRLAALLFGLWPSQLFLTSVLASEHLGLLAALAAQATLVAAINPPTPRWTSVALSGVLMAVAAAVRAALMVLLLAGVLTVVLLCRPARRAAISLLLLVGGFWLTHAVYRQGVNAIYHLRPYAQLDWTLLQGTNFESHGAWNEADARNFMDRPTFEDARAFARAEALHRITSEPQRFAQLVVRKQVELWRDDWYGVQWSLFDLEARSAAVTARKDALIWVSRCYQVFVLLCGTAGCFLAAQADAQRGVVLILFLLLVGTWVHGIFEVQSRYHYVLEPALFVLAARAAVTVRMRRPLAG